MPRTRRHAPPRHAPLSEPADLIGSSTQDELNATPTTQPVAQSTLEGIQHNEPETARGSSSLEQRHSHIAWTVDVINDRGGVKQMRLRVQDLIGIQDGMRVLTSWNAEGQPIGESAGLLAGFLGAIASNFDNFLILYENWRKVPGAYKENINVQTIKKKLVVNDGDNKKFILSSLGKKWKNNCCRLFNEFYNWELSFEQNCQSHPPRIPPDHWVIFLQHRMSEKTKAIAEKNSINREKQVIPHTLGSKSLARKRDELETKDGQPYTRGDMYPIAHKKRDGSYVNEKAKEKDELLQKEVQETSSENEAFVKVFGKEHSGHVRGMGSGVTPSHIFGPTCYPRGSSSSQSADAKIEKLECEVSKFKAQLSEVSELKAQLAFFMQNLNGNQATNFESTREPRRSSSSSHVPDAQGASSSDTH